ncbi:MAG: minichromosome maintenance protein MCM [Candidatus Nitrosocosmicus sp.]|nr:minichromosome maintenance protein MCM [Candidatus Nitrosocosmicus sp.]MDN5867117.1 minichromosome maintenance protein MCM [Candidatus Nitrosocosmicus sp.]
MEDPFDEFTVPTGGNNYEEVGINSALPDDLERDICKSLTDCETKDRERPYLDELSSMLEDFHETGYMTFLTNFKDLSVGLQGFLQKDNSYYQFIKASQNAVKYLLYLYQKEYIQENIIDPFHVVNYEQICKHIPAITIRIKNFNYDLSVPDISKAIPIRAAKAASMTRLQTFKGVIVSIAQSTVDLTKMKMTCNNPECRYNHTVAFYEMETLTNTSKCSKCGKVGLTMSEPETQDVQILTLYDINDANSLSSSVQASLKCIVNQDLTDKVEIGDSVLVTGLPRIDLDDEKSKKLWSAKVKNNDYYVQMDAFRSRTGGVPFPKILEVNYIEVNDADDHSNFKGKIDQIKELQKRPDLSELLIRSFCPQIYGHEDVKEGLLHALAGGIGRNTTGGKIDKRGNIHVMIISDPSVGKSELLKYCAKLMKRGIFVSATSSTKVGLTGAATRDEKSGKWMIEAGAILRANNGILCIDEIGHLKSEDQAAIYEVAEQEQYTISKAGILKTFPVNVILIVSGNPIDGRYNPDMSASQNLGQFAAPFLSRFDEKYIFRDIPNEFKDRSIIRHVLKQVNGELDTSGLIPFELLAAYISYVRNCGVIPKMTEAAMQRIEDYYWSKRKDADVNDMTKPAPIGVREGEGISRMCFARARLLNQEIIDVSDVDKIIELHEKMIYKVAFDPKTGQVDPNNYNGGKTAFQASVDVKVMNKLEEMIERNGTDRVDLQTFYSECQADNVATRKDVDIALGNFERMGKTEIRDSFIILKKKQEYL